MNIAIIGAGVGGLAAAYDLVRVGHHVVIYEATDQVGGLAGGFKEPHWEWSVEKYYHHWFASDRHVLELIDELGWKDKVVFKRLTTVMYHAGKFYPFDSIPSALLFPGLGWGIGKFRFGLASLFLRLTNNWHPLEQTTVEKWMTKWVGKRVYELMWQPLLVGKFNQHYKNVNMAWMWARMKARTARLGTFIGGFQAFADELANHLKTRGIDLHLSCPVTRINPQPEGGLTLSFNGSTQHFDQCLVTTSPALLARLAPDLPPSYLDGLLRLKSMGAVVLVLALTQPLSKDKYYWFNLPKSAGFPFLALVEHTNFLSPDCFGGDHVVYCGDYLDPNHEYFHLDQAELLDRFIPALVRFNPQFSTNWIQKSWLFRTAYAQPVPEVNQSQHIPSIRTPIPGLYFASMSQVYPWDRGTNFAVQIGRQAVGLMIEDQKSY